MRPLFQIVVIPDDGEYTADQIHTLLQKAQEQGHPLDIGSYLHQMSLQQLDALVNGRTDA